MPQDTPVNKEEGIHELDDLKGQRNYRGCVVVRIIGGFSIWGEKVSTAIEVDELIDKAGSILNESIDKSRNDFVP
ncbi:MAG: hypothetical protein V4547_17070 [Bacteroidota bacterium]